MRCVITALYYLMNKETKYNIMIAKRLKELPTNELLRMAQTVDQIRHWARWKIYQDLLSRAWAARFLGGDDPLWSSLESKEIDENTYNFVWHTVDWYEQLWGLVQLSASYVDEECNRLGWEYPFKSAYELFDVIVSEIVEINVVTCFQSYYEYSSGKNEKGCRLAIKKFRGQITPIQDQALQTWLNQGATPIFLHLVLCVCKKRVSKRKSALKSKLEAFNAASERMLETDATFLRKVGSYAWKNGQRVKASRFGGTYPDA